ncbi:hypothetical protein FC84_GL001623 [Lapidilactobacillus dextrinicus DSM 20335]|uniref:Uncharacterized protein n=1 Tax=Lapidilactobacillus dextrinicus DSM 20335 TaxID=1423738 RepID=A0A0R2BNH6_9LACO|nr:hypothetical protein [Lapidilactobacillus dextrinicus]KRM79444.1 hypothetical protein FC84_GL001623 [Lapidilactobacillus dextrinicus DSM 20335]QFG46722.1 hypothetical protein LH506_04350 [Lapidilactobacillus dextrinicus]
MDISKALHRVEKRLNVTPKVVQTDTHNKYSKSTIYNWWGGSNIKANDAVEVSKAIKDFATANDLASQFFGIFRMLDGDKFKEDALSVEAFAEFEEQEKVDAFSKYHVRKLLASSDLTHAEQKDLYDSACELLDSLLMNYKLLVLICEEQHIDLWDVYKERRKYYINAGYVEPERKEKLWMRRQSQSMD